MILLNTAITACRRRGDLTLRPADIYVSIFSIKPDCTILKLTAIEAIVRDLLVDISPNFTFNIDMLKNRLNLLKISTKNKIKSCLDKAKYYAGAGPITQFDMLFALDEFIINPYQANSVEQNIARTKETIKALIAKKNMLMPSETTLHGIANWTREWMPQFLFSMIQSMYDEFTNKKFLTVPVNSDFWLIVGFYNTVTNPDSLKYVEYQSGLSLAYTAFSYDYPYNILLYHIWSTGKQFDFSGQTATFSKRAGSNYLYYLAEQYTNYKNTTLPFKAFAHKVYLASGNGTFITATHLSNERKALFG